MAISFISKVISSFRALFGSGNSAAKQNTSHTSKTKIFEKNEGEYVEFEEIK